MQQDNKSETAKGIIRPQKASEVFKFETFQPTNELKPWIEFYWSVTWDLGTGNYDQMVITNPTLDLSFEDDPSTNGAEPGVFITGVVPKAYVRHLSGKAQVFAVHFAPGMFKSFWPCPVSELTGKVLKFPVHGTAFEQSANLILPEILSAPIETRAKIVDQWLLKNLPVKDNVANEICKIVQGARYDKAQWNPMLMADRRAVSVRTNQRDFLEYVGVGPKWVIKRFRIQSALDWLDANPLVLGKESRQKDLTELAISLGYYDLAHFSREFRDIVGISPSHYKQSS